MPRSYESIADLPVHIDGYRLEALSRGGGSGRVRRTTVVRLEGSGAEGVGEDVVYDPDAQVRQAELGPVLDLAGDWTLDTFSKHVSALDLFYGDEPVFPVYVDFRRWALESAALDLALRQAGEPLHAILERTPRPVRFSVSLWLGAPPSLAGVVDRISTYGGVRFKLDAEPSWDPELVAALAETGAVDVIDFKGAYKGTPVDVDTDAELYASCADAFPDAWLEDPDLTDARASEALAAHRERITWDAPIHSVGDVKRLAFAPRGLNSKPSRFGSLARLFDFYDYCAQEGITLYGGGQSELGPGRGQIQLLASLFHPDAPNDVAPYGWDQPEFPRQGLPTSPVDPRPASTGFRRAD